MSNNLIANRYEVFQHIGQGGMADVFLAVDTILNRQVAVKILRSELCTDAVSVLRFEREAQAATALSHPNIVEIYDVGEYKGHHYIVMEYVSGKPLKKMIQQRGALLTEEAIDIMIQLTSATAEAHRRGIIHRDIKPQNVIVKSDGSIKMLDFGIALAKGSMQLTQANNVMGSVHYLAPELAKGQSGAQYHRCKLILGSATPSLESYARALKNVYHLVRLKHRVNNCLPDVTIVPLKDAMRKGQSYIITDTLQEKLEQTLAQGKQAILLLNRRGYHTMLRCNSCKEPLKCRHCDITLSYHHASRTMVCHSCGASVPVPSQCPSCHAAKGFSSYGYGTEKLEQEVRCRFPDARVLRMDADTTSVKNGHEKILNAFGRREADILVGTQMIAKGLDYPDVTLVGILNGDEGLSRTDYRSCEVTFDLLMQAAGRSGRADAKGEVVLQVFDPGHYAVTAAAKQDYDLFFKHEMYYRHAAMQPPYTYLISLTVGSRTEEDCRLIAEKLMEGLDGPFKTIGIIPLPKRRDTYRNRLMLKGKDPEVMRRAVRGLFEQMPELSRKDIRIDVNPLTLE